VPTPVHADGLVVITIAHGKGRRIYAIRTGDSADSTDNQTAIAWTEGRGGNYMPTPLVDGGPGSWVCAAAGLPDGAIRALNPYERPPSQ